MDLICFKPFYGLQFKAGSLGSLNRDPNVTLRLPSFPPKFGYKHQRYDPSGTDYK